MTSDPVDRFERERRAADQRYNDALTALDHAVRAVASQPSLERADFDRLSTALIVFLQQITAFVESKDREAAASIGARLAALEPLAELRTQVNVLQRSVQSLCRQSPVAPPPSSVGGEPPSRPANPPSPVGGGPRPPIGSHAARYVAFEDEFRGADAAIEEKLRAYVPIFSAASDVLDIGCGRGEFLAALGAAGIRARGVDANAAMAAAARERGLDATTGDALAYLDALPDDSLGGVIAAQVVEHLEPAYLMRLVDALALKLRPGAPIVLETINPACWLAFFSSYIRDFTHVRPVHPETLQYLLRASGFTGVEIRYSTPVAEQMKMKTIDLPPNVLASTEPSAIALAGVAQTVNVNAVILNHLMFSYLDYAVVGFRA
jgi:SAM-dependent methyltransferase